MQDDPYAERKKLTFAQAEGVEPLPRQLTLKELSSELRAKLWVVIHDSMLQRREYHHFEGFHLLEPWTGVLYRKHVHRDHRMADEFKNLFEPLTKELKEVFTKGDYVAVFDLLEWLLSQRDCPLNRRLIEQALTESRAAYRLLADGKTIVPITDAAERHTINQAFADLAGSEFHGARAHLQAAARILTTGKPADSIRESIHAVESVANSLSGAKTLGDALGALEKNAYVHPSLKKGFSALYGFTSDESGIRHALLEKDAADVDETDAIFMIGACASFVSYLINKHRDAA